MRQGLLDTPADEVPVQAMSPPSGMDRHAIDVSDPRPGFAVQAMVFAEVGVGRAGQAEHAIGREPFTVAQAEDAPANLDVFGEEGIAVMGDEIVPDAFPRQTVQLDDGGQIVRREAARYEIGRCQRMTSA